MAEPEIFLTDDDAEALLSRREGPPALTAVIDELREELVVEPSAETAGRHLAGMAAAADPERVSRRCRRVPKA